jgi:transcriptional regulator with XRE-family HTH domain
MSRENALPQFTMNLRWMVRLKNPDPERWAEFLVGMLRNFISPQRASGLLQGASPRPEEMDAIAEVTGRDIEELQSVPLYGGAESIFRENLHYLLGALPKGEAKEAAKRIGITASQLSRWRSNVDRPHPANVKGLLRFLGVDPDTNLHTAPLFLSIEPVSGYGKRKWVVDRIQKLPAEEITKIFPALQKMLHYDDGN